MLMSPTCPRGTLPFKVILTIFCTIGTNISSEAEQSRSDIICIRHQYYTAQGFDYPFYDDRIIKVLKVVAPQYGLYQVIQKNDRQNKARNRDDNVIT